MADIEAHGEDGRPPLSEAQLEIMKVAWERGEVTVAEVWKALSTGRSLARNTVQTMMVRLEEKGWLECVAEGHAFRYRAACPRDEAVSGMVNRLVDSAFDGSAGGLILTLLERHGVTPEEAARIRTMIDRAQADRRKTR